MAKRAEEGAVVKALRVARFVDFLFVFGGLQPAGAEEGAALPVAPYFLSFAWAEGKELFDYSKAETGQLFGKPRPIDWSRQTHLRKRQQQGSEQGS
eukprot:5135154-Lingulodinium_polyedra.AAC.1